MSLDINLEYMFEFKKPINQYQNMDFLLKVYANPKLWAWFYEEIYKEYKDNSEYIKSVNKHKDYSSLIKNDSMIYFKLTNSINKSKRFQYRLGLNVDVNDFKPYGCCSGGGLYFCELKDIYQFEKFGKYLTPVIVPKNIPIYKESHEPNVCKCNIKSTQYNKYKAPVLYALPRIRIDDILFCTVKNVQSSIHLVIFIYSFIVFIKSGFLIQ
jgi:hypothetical protein